MFGKIVRITFPATPYRPAMPGIAQGEQDSRGWLPILWWDVNRMEGVTTKLENMPPCSAGNEEICWQTIEPETP